MTLNIPFFKVLPPEPLILVLSGLSGSGKDTVIEAMKNDPDFEFHFIVTMNTREPRENEIDGVDYHFVAREKFESMIANGELIEYAKVYDDYKGIPRFEVERAFAGNRDILLRVDHQGAHKVKQQYPNSFSIFLLPPDSKIWSERLITRGTDSADNLQTRFANANDELDHISEFDYVVVNDSLEQTIRRIYTIISAERCRTKRVPIRRQDKETTESE